MATTLGNGKRFGSPMMTAASKRAENRTIENLRFNMQSTDRKSTRLNSSHDQISYAVFCLKKKKKGALAQGGADLHEPYIVAGLDAFLLHILGQRQRAEECTGGALAPAAVLQLLLLVVRSR